ncbi:hypothetical protein [Nocardiopsis synnemataformans]|uniref:hypothetical protein n=1 Tax=Nocardiopsis synnemataformans TaxID=61305 RepID=UPI003EBF8CE8
MTQSAPTPTPLSAGAFHLLLTAGCVSLATAVCGMGLALLLGPAAAGAPLASHLTNAGGCTLLWLGGHCVEYWRLRRKDPFWAGFAAAAARVSGILALLPLVLAWTVVLVRLLH